MSLKMNIQDKPYVQLVNGRYGPCYVFKGDWYLGGSVISYGEYNKDECEHIVQLANEKKGLVIDIGANIGNISQALISAGHQVVAFEPQPEVFELLKLNCPEATLHNVGLGSSNITMKMPKMDYSQKNNYGGVSLSLGGELDVEVKTLDSFNFENVSLIKIDVEGFELQVLLGGTKTIANSKPIIYLEADRPDKLTSIAKKLEALGYTYTPHHPPLFNPDNFFKNTRNIWERHIVSDNWECRPTS
ncbi:FkbM family methyltransferase [Polynucleobacter paneuropaeus]|nr:FkbM family methyltransferase [Polynucleobacter paneuropaeus]